MHSWELVKDAQGNLEPRFGVEEQCPALVAVLLPALALLAEAGQTLYHT